MPRQKLSPRIVQTATPAPDKAKLDLFDTEVPGLLLKVLKSGNRTYYVRQRTTGGKTVERKLANARVVSLRQARRLARERLAQALEPEKPAPSPTLQAFIKEWYLPYVASYKRSWHTDERLLRTHILPRFGDQPMDRIRRYDLQHMLQELSERYQPATINRLLILVRYAFNLAVSWEVPGVTSNPADGINTHKVHNKHERYLTGEEAQRLFAQLDSRQNPHLRPIITMLLFTGARRSEVLRARWEDIDFDQATWRIPQPKATERRHVPLSERVLAMLGELHASASSEYLFPNPRTGRPYGEIFNAWKSARERAGLPDLRLHDLRHSFASFLVNSGHSLYEVQKLLGHTQINTTQRYAHLSQERLLAASNDVARLIDSASHAPESAADKEPAQ